MLVGRSNVPEFSFRWFADNPLHGRTLNPWDANLTPGGSSGGAASAVAAGMVPLAQGNDIGGSVRYPAYACGVAGLRPTIGRIPADSGFRDPDRSRTLGSQFMCTHGPIARSVADLRLGFTAMAGYDARDSVSVPFSVVDHDPVQRVGLLRDPGVMAPDPVVDEALTMAADALRVAGVEVVEVVVPEFAEAHRLWGLMLIGLLQDVHRYSEDDTRIAIDYMLAHTTAIWGDDPTARELADAWRNRNDVLVRLGAVFGETPVILAPSSATPPAPYGSDTAGGEVTQRLHEAQWPQKSVAALGLPGLSLPVGTSQGRLPSGVQLVGARFSDESLLEVGQLIEDSVGVFPSWAAV